MKWVDPNGGCPADAIEVYCNIETQQTCVYPSSSKIVNGTNGMEQFNSPVNKHIHLSELRYMSCLYCH